jgi:hypothetical protein
MKITLSETQIYWLAYAAEKLHDPHSKSCGSSQCSMAIIDILRSIGRWNDAGFVSEEKAAKRRRKELAKYGINGPFGPK